MSCIRQPSGVQPGLRQAQGGPDFLCRSEKDTRAGDFALKAPGWWNMSRLVLGQPPMSQAS